VLADLAHEIGYKIFAFVDKKPTQFSSYLDIAVLSESDFFQSFDLDNFEYVIGIGDNFLRQEISLRLIRRGLSTPSLVSPNSWISKSAHIGLGSVILQNTVIQANANIGEFTIVNNSTSINHDSIVGQYCHIAPGSTLCGNVRVQDFTTIGAGCTVIPSVNIGSNSVIGAGSCVVSDIPDNILAFGVPAQIK
jgi:sugar O-acyltransferase (sialic acid O-acetyltransferase NeuD family)